MVDAAGKQREKSPGDTGDGHQDGAQRIGGANARQKEIDESRERQPEPDPRQARELFTFPQGDAEHGELHAADQDQGARAGAPAACRRTRRRPDNRTTPRWSADLRTTNRGKCRRYNQTMRMSIVAAERTRRVVKVAASINLGARASRQRSELAAKHSIAPLRQNDGARDRDCLLRYRRSETRRNLVSGPLPDIPAIWSASRAASSPTPARNDEFILDSQCRPRK